MANELLNTNMAIPVSFAFKVENVTTDGTPVDGTLASAQGSDGLLVPTGYTFHPVMIFAESNAAVSAGGINVYACDDGTELLNGPTVALASGTQAATGVARHGATSMAAASVIGVSGTSTGALDAATKDLDVVLTGVFLPA